MVGSSSSVDHKNHHRVIIIYQILWELLWGGITQTVVPFGVIDFLGSSFDLLHLEQFNLGSLVEVKSRNVNWEISWIRKWILMQCKLCYPTIYTTQEHRIQIINTWQVGRNQFIFRERVEMANQKLICILNRRLCFVLPILRALISAALLTILIYHSVACKHDHEELFGCCSFCGWLPIHFHLGFDTKAGWGYFNGEN